MNSRLIGDVNADVEISQEFPHLLRHSLLSCKGKICRVEVEDVVVLDIRRRGPCGSEVPNSLKETTRSEIALREPERPQTSENLSVCRIPPADFQETFGFKFTRHQLSIAVS
jgi:hypothetical protein